MDEVKLTVRLSADERRELKLHAVSQGQSIQSLVTDLIRAELATSTPPVTTKSREEFVAALYARRGVDPDSPEHTAIEERARASVQVTDP